MKSRTLKLQTLIDKRACDSQVKLFRDMFGGSVRITPGLCRSVADKFDFDWAARHLLSAPAYKAYGEALAPAYKAYDDALTTAEKAYNDVAVTAEKAFNVVAVTAWKVYEEALAPAEKAYREALAPAEKAYDDARVVAFAHAYINDKGA